MRRCKIVISSIIFLIVLFINITNTSTIFTLSLSSGVLNEKTLYVGGNGPNNYTYIQDAIDHALPGDKIFIYDDSSPYYESLRIEKDNISLIGENRNTTVIASSSDPWAIYIFGDNVKISTLTIKGGENGLWSEYGDNLLISNCSFPSYNIYRYGINLKSKNNIIFNSYISSAFLSTGYGLVSFNNSFISCKIDYIEIRTPNNTIMNCNISKLFLCCSPHCTIVNNSFIEGIQITGNEMEDWIHRIENNTVGGKPILYYKNRGKIAIKDLEIGELILTNSSNINITNVSFQRGAIVAFSHNITFYSSASPYIRLYYSSNCYIDGRYIPKTSLTNSHNNKMSGFKHSSLSLYKSNYNDIYKSKFNGVYVEEGNGNNFSRCDFERSEKGIAIELMYTKYNNFSSCNISNSHYGAYVASSHIDFYKCNFSNNEFALILLGSHNKIIKNIIYNNKEGIHLLWSKNNTIQKNLILENNKGIVLEVYFDTGPNKINYNNFIKNNIHAEIYFLDKAMLFNNWNRNYWDNWLKFIPKPIPSYETFFGTRFISWLNIDWFPLPAPVIN